MQGLNIEFWNWVLNWNWNWILKIENCVKCKEKNCRQFWRRNPDSLFSSGGKWEAKKRICPLGQLASLQHTFSNIAALNEVEYKQCKMGRNIKITDHSLWIMYVSSTFIRVRKRVQNIFVFLICTQETKFPFYKIKRKSNWWEGDEIRVVIATNIDLRQISLESMLIYPLDIIHAASADWIKNLFL